MGRSGSVRKRRDTPGWFSRGFSYLIIAGYSRQAIGLDQAAGLSDQLLSKKTVLLMCENQQKAAS
jgi:hypothetical protein